MQSEADLALQAYKDVARSCQRALDILAEESDRTEEIRAGGMLSLALFHLGDEKKALRIADATAGRIRGVDLTSYIMLEGFAGVCEVYVLSCEKQMAGNVAPSRALEMKARASLASLHKFARVFPVSKAKFQRLRGRLMRALGRERLANRALRKSVSEALHLEMPLEHGLAMEALSKSPSWGQQRTSNNDSPTRPGNDSHT